MQSRFMAILTELLASLPEPEAPVSILAGVSGGMDSMCLAELLLRSGRPFGVAHCNFRLRGSDSEADAALVRAWASERNIPFYETAFDTPAYADAHGISIEMAARELRYRFFEETAAAEGYGAVAVAHHANDNAETLVLNLLRGTGLKGICGMAPAGILPVPGSETPLLRPLLTFTREEIAAFVLEENVPYREDRTNAEDGPKRNLVRNRIFPLFREINPSFVQTLNRDMARFAALRSFLESLPEEFSGCGFSEASGAGAAEDSVPGESPKPIPVPVRYVLTEEPWDGTESVLQEGGRLILDADRIKGALAERSWEPGDWIRPLGMRGRKKLQDWFTDRHVPVAEKKAAVLFHDTAADDSRHVLAVISSAGACIDRSVRVTSATRRIYRIVPESVE